MKPNDEDIIVFGKNIKNISNFQEALQQVQSQIEIIISNENMLKHLLDSRIIDFLIYLKINRNIDLKILTPFLDNEKHYFHRLAPFITYKVIETFNQYEFSIFIFDKLFLYIFYLNPLTKELEILSYSNNKPPTNIIEACFSTIWKYIENYEYMIKEKKHAELLVDLITHDIGNHHQIEATSLQLISTNINKILHKKVSFDEIQNILTKLRKYCDSAENALFRSEHLVENIRRLEKMYREKNVTLIQIDILETIKSAFSLVQQNANSLKKTIDLVIENQTSKTSLKIVADEFLEDIFVNLFSNSVRYTDNTYVKIDLTISDYNIGSNNYYMVAISDYSRGISDDRKTTLFQRFYSYSQGSGLGLSLVKALVERYNGKIWVGDRVYKDHTKGTKFGMIFPAIR